MPEMSGPLGLTPSQTVGPYLHIGLEWPDGPYVVPEGTPGAVRIRGVVSDGNGDPVTDALVETWQADPAGRFNHPDDPRGAGVASMPRFRGFGRCPTDRDGHYEILTLKPGALPAMAGGDDEEVRGNQPADPKTHNATGRMQAPHIAVSVFGRGLLNRVVTRIYFPDEDVANAADPVLSSIAEYARRSTLIAVPAEDGLRFDIRLQGEHETVFFAV